MRPRSSPSSHKRATGANSRSVSHARTKIFVSPLPIWEAVVGLARESRYPFEKSEQLVNRFVQEIQATTIGIDDEIGREALRASRLYGRGRHGAALNFGDCFSYACAKILGVPLLCKGNDFPQTDIKLA
ncbi:type II toxin-antitoxin system VapC family toxin [Allomesorhizobium camelthorni]|uniref:type II toxin-antitoxin system VapC family toxin n=1 Tax=Allomesorhizobium camelthorni TaxID=475069 RepID=UPI001981EA04|nr:type II toxin-antitoxin system VapC family toxin [Mesorhizobium camelthorni]